MALTMKVPSAFRGLLTRLTAVAMVGVLSACAPAVVRTELTSFNEWSSAPSEKSYTFSRTLQFQNSLEVQSYEGLVRQELDRIGFREARDPGSAKLIVTLRPSLSVIDYGWSGGDPFFFHRPYWHGGWHRYGSMYYPYWDPIYDWNRDPPTYLKKLQLEIDLQGIVPVKRLYEATAATEGWDNSLTKSMPYLVRAIFADFPGNNGATREIVIPAQ